jgi:peptide/nickel transport system substrate-binding protein
VKDSILKVMSVLLIVLVALGAFGVVAAQEGDTLNILYWQAVSTMNPYLSAGTKDIHASSMVLEPLAGWNPDGELVPRLAVDIPTVANGGVTEDLMSITWTLRDDIVWSDGTPVTTDDVVFSYEYCTHPEGGCASAEFYTDIESVVAGEGNTVTVNFSVVKPFPYDPFTSAQAPIIQKAQFENCLGTAAAQCTDANFYPIGTGPYVVEDFRANDVVTFVANPNYREEGKPYFPRVVFKGGGDAESAARAVLETGEADYAWNLQISPAVLGQMEAAGLGTVVTAFTASIERLQVNQTNPDPDLGENRSLYLDGNNPHPFLTHPAVKQAMTLAIDRDIIAQQLYGNGGVGTCNYINGPAAVVSTANDPCPQDIEGAKALLDEAGIVDSNGDGVRELDGVPLSIVYQTSTNAVRQSTQALIKQWWEEIGIETELRNIDAAVFFGADPASPDTYQKFFADVEMFTSGPSGPDPTSFVVRYICSEMPGPENGWLGRNEVRFCDDEYDALYEELLATGDQAARAEIVKRLNDIIVQDGALIPLVFRGDVSAHANSIEGVWINGWDSEMWNIADWTRSS